MMNLLTQHPLTRARDVNHEIAEIVRAPRRTRPSDAAAAYLKNDRGAWEKALAPEMIEPLDLLASREYTGIVFVGPSRSSKTFSLVLGAVAWVVRCSPGDLSIISMSEAAARKFSRKELDRVIRHSPEILAQLSPRARDDNTYDKFFRSGIALTIGWPAVSQLSSDTLKYIVITDYDRPENRDDVDGEGPLWDLAAKRVETFMSRGKCLAESSPGESIIDPNWTPSTPHEAPPALGILSLYNRGTRARRYWPCKHCGELFEAKPGPEAFRLPSFEELEKLVVQHDLMTLAEKYARLYCPHCGGEHEMRDRAEMKRRGRWVHEGERINRAGEVSGERRRSNIASFWLGGVAATYQRWDGMLLKYFQAVAAYVRTGDESELKAKTGTDFAAPYLPRKIANRKSIEEYRQRLEDWPPGLVPQGVRFLTTAVDVQGRSFVVETFGWGAHLEMWLVDRYTITASMRPEGDRYAGLEPAAYREDWDVLLPLIEKTYPVDGLPDFTMPVQLVVCDSGGQDGVTQRAYEFWRRMRDRGHVRRFALVKGDNRLNAPRTQLTYPETRGRKDRDAGARGDVPLWLLNSNLLKDAISGDLAREQPGPGYVHLPRWLPREFFEELTAETRTARGWERERGKRNEAFDLHYYNRAACILIKAETIDWQNPPAWAREPVPGAPTKANVISIEDLARQLNG